MIIVNNPTSAAGIGKNYFKNPNFAVIQGTASGTLANSTALPTASLGYLGETEWGIAAAGGTPAYAFSSANESVTFTGAASTTAIYLLQRLESRDVVTLANKLATITFSAEISNSLLTSVIWEVFRPTTTADAHGTIGTPTQTLIASGTFTVNSTLTKYSATFTLPALVSRGLEVRLRVGAQTSGTWVVARLQLEEGSIATNFSCDKYLETRVNCQRYYRKSYLDASPNGSISDNNYFFSYGNANGSISARVGFEYEMFTNPIVVTWDTNGNINSALTLTGGGIPTTRTPSLNASSKRLTVAASTTDVLILFHYTASAHIP